MKEVSLRAQRVCEVDRLVSMERSEEGCIEVDGQVIHGYKENVTRKTRRGRMCARRQGGREEERRTGKRAEIEQKMSAKKAMRWQND